MQVFYYFQWNSTRNIKKIYSKLIKLIYYYFLFHSTAQKKANSHRTEENLGPMMRIRSQSANETSKPLNHRRSTLTGKPNFSPSGELKFLLILNVLIWFKKQFVKKKCCKYFCSIKKMVYFNLPLYYIIIIS